jgi:hypothetical protein
MLRCEHNDQRAHIWSRWPGAPGFIAKVQQFQPMYGDVEEWVRDVFAPVFARSIGGPVKWCVQWWAHDEAVLHLEALWPTSKNLTEAAGDGSVSSGSGFPIATGHQHKVRPTLSLPALLRL